MALELLPAHRCAWDCVALGEVMLRLDPGDERVRSARTFAVHEGGGEYNVARNLRRAFGHRTSVVTALVDNEVGRLAEELILAGGVDTRHIVWRPFDGVGRDARVGLNFTERGYGPRPARSTYDRGHSAAAQLAPGEIEWDHLFGTEGVRWLHTGGIMAALSPDSAEVMLEAMQAAKRHGTVISYDLNYRASMWRDQGGQQRAIDVNRRVAELVDVMIGNEEDFTAALGFEVPGTDPDLSELDPAGFAAMIDQVRAGYPSIRVIATTLRNAKTASVNDWGAVLFAEGELHEATRRPDLEIYDRVGGGDGFASGLAHAFLSGKTPMDAVEYGAAHGALVQSTPGDVSKVTEAEVASAIERKGARAIR